MLNIFCLLVSQKAGKDHTCHLFGSFKLEFGTSCSADVKLSTEQRVPFFAAPVQTGAILLLKLKPCGKKRPDASFSLGV